MKKIYFSLLLMVGVSVFASEGAGGGGADKYGNSDTGANPKNAEYVRWYNEYYHSHYNDYGKTNPCASLASAPVVTGTRTTDVQQGSKQESAHSQTSSVRAAYKAQPIILDAQAGAIRCLQNLSDGRIVAVYEDGTVRVWNPEKPDNVVLLSGHTDLVTCIVVMPDDRIVTGSLDSTIRVWNLKKAVDEPGYVRVLSGHTDAVNCLLVKSDGRIASGSSDKTIRVWNIDSLGDQSQDVVVLGGHRKEVTCLVELSSSRIVSASDDKTVRLWDLDSDETFVLDGQSSAWDLYILFDKRVVIRTAFDLRVCSPDIIGDRSISINISGKSNIFATLQDGRVISGSRNGTLEIFHAAALDDEPVTFQLQNSSVNSLIELENGCIAIGLGNGVIQVWSEFVSEKDPITFHGHTKSVSHLIELGDGCLVSGSSDGVICVYQREEYSIVAAKEVVSENLVIEAEPADQEEEFDSKRDQEVEDFYNVVKIPALLQKMIKRPGLAPEYLQNCHFYAMFNVYLLNSVLENADDLDQGDPAYNPFQSEEAFQAFLQAFDLVQEFDRAAYLPTLDEKTKSIMKSIDPSISCIIPIQIKGILSRHDREDAHFENYLNLNRRYQVFIYKKLRHWVAFGIDYSKDEIYFVDSVENYKKQKYSSTDIKIIVSIRDAMFALKNDSSDNRAKPVTGGGSK